MSIRCGHAILISHRAEIAKALFENLPEQARSRVLLDKRVESIDVLPQGVKVTCQDGTSETGSIVIGADGVRSKVRQVMGRLRSGASGTTPEEGKLPYTSSYRVFFGDLPVPPGLLPGSDYEGVRHGVSTQILVGSRRAWFNVYEKLETPTSEHVRYTSEDQAQVLKKWGHLWIAPGYRLHDIYHMKSNDTGLINLEEGVVDQWWWNRIVLVGDAVRKLTPNAGWGYNMGVADIVVLTNRLRRLLEADKSPETTAIGDLFHKYQLGRSKDTQKTHDLSMRRIRGFAFPSPKDGFVVKYILPWWNLGKLEWRLSLRPLHTGSPVLEWVAENALPKHSKPYKHYPLLPVSLDERKTV